MLRAERQRAVYGFTRLGVISSLPHHSIIVDVDAADEPQRRRDGRREAEFGRDSKKLGPV